MKTYSNFFSKALLLLAFVTISNSSFSQAEKFPAEFHYNNKTSKLVLGDQVNITFLLSKIDNQAEYQQLMDKFSKQDGIRKVNMSPLDATNGTCICSFTFNNKPEHPFKPAYLQKVMAYMGVPGVYFDEELVETDRITVYMVGKEKEEYRKQNGK